MKDDSKLARDGLLDPDPVPGRVYRRGHKIVKILNGGASTCHRKVEDIILPSWLVRDDPHPIPDRRGGICEEPSGGERHGRRGATPRGRPDPTVEQEASPEKEPARGSVRSAPIKSPKKRPRPQKGAQKKPPGGGLKERRKVCPQKV